MATFDFYTSIIVNFTTFVNNFYSCIFLVFLHSSAKTTLFCLKMSMKPFIDLRQIQEVTGLISSIFGFCLNFLLLYLILKRTGPKLKSYQKILLQNCIVDIYIIIYNIAIVVTRTQTDIKNGNLYVITTSAYGQLPFLTTRILATIWTSGTFLCVTSLPVQFIYRYFFIVKKINLSGKQYTILLTISSSIGVLYGFIVFWLMNPPQDILDETSKLLYTDPFYYKKDLNFIVESIQRWPLMLMGIFVAIMINGSYGIVLWTSYKVWKHLKVMEVHMSSQTRNAHHQMTKAMIAQATIPFIFNLLPIFISLIMVIFFVTVDGLGLAISLIFCWIPVANSLTTILIVNSYRNFVISIFKRLLYKQNGTSTNVASTQSSFGKFFRAKN